MCWYLLKDKTKDAEYIYGYIVWLDRNARHKAKRVHTDNAEELLVMQKKLAKMRIDLITSTAYSAQSNGLAEGTNRTLMDKTSVMLETAGAEKQLRGEALLNTAYLQSIIPTAIISMRTLHELPLGKVPNKTDIHTFGCKECVHKGKAMRTNRLDDHAEGREHIGNKIELRTVLIPGMATVVTSKHVTFHESTYHFSGSNRKQFDLRRGLLMRVLKSLKTSMMKQRTGNR